MNTLELFNDNNLKEYLGEGWRVLPNIDKEKYQARKGLEGPYRTNSGKVVYYDPKEGKYYDPDSDMYMSHDDYEALDESVKSYLAGALLAGLMGLGAHQVANMTNAQNSPLGKAMAQAAENGDEYAAKQLDKLDAYFDLNDTGSIKVLSKKYLGKVIEGVVTEQDIATTKKSQRILNMLKQRNPAAKNDLEALLLAFEKGQKQDRMDINRLGAENDAEEADIARHDQILNQLEVTEADQESRKEKTEKSIRQELEKKFGASKKRQAPGEEERKQLAAKSEADRKVQSQKRQEYGFKLAKQFGYEIAPKEINYFLIGVVDGKAGTVDRKASDNYGPNVYAYDKGVSAGTTMREKTNEDYYETDEQRELARLGRILKDIGMKRDDKVGEVMGFLGTQLTRYGTPQGVNSMEKLQKVTGQPESVIMKMMALAQKVQGDVAVGDETASDDEVNEADFDTNFKKRVGYTVKGGDAAKMMKKQAAQAQADNPDAGTGLGPGVLNISKARKKAKEKGVRAPGNLRSSPDTRNPERLPEAESQMVSATIPNNTFDSASKLQRLARDNGVEYKRLGRTVTLKGEKTNVKNIFYKMAYDPANHPELTPVNEAQDHDIKIGDTVQTQKMGQMQGTVTGFSKKSGITKVLFKHESGKTYATVPENLKVIDAKKTEGSSSLNELDLYGAYEDYVRMPNGSYLKIKYRSTGEPDTQYSKQSFIGKPEPVDTATVQRLQLDKRTKRQASSDPKRSLHLGGGNGFGSEPGSKTPFAPRDIYVVDYEDTQPAIKKALTKYLAQDIHEAKKKPIPTDPSKWSYYKSQAKKKFDVYPSAYANAWAAKQYKAAGGGWRMGKPKK